MKADSQKELQQMKKELLDDMREYMNECTEEGDAPGYVESDIGKCEVILDKFLSKLSAMSEEDKGSVMSAVEEVVLALNTLNDACDGNIIETDQREQLCDLIMQGAAAVGVGDGEEDLTEEWREW